MTTTFLRFADEAEFLAACAASGIEPAQEITLPDATSISVYGIKMDDTDPENPVPLPWYRVNLLGTLPDGWAAHQCNPATPDRVF